MKTDESKKCDARTGRRRGDAEKKHFSFCRYSMAHFIAASLGRRIVWPLLLLFATFMLACNVGERQSGVQPEAQATIDSVTRDIAEGHYEKIYNEAAEEWRQNATLEQSNAIFGILKTKLGNVRGRSLLTGKQQNTNNSGASSTLILRYNTTFERGEGMETFTLLERDGRWLLAGYSVNSNALK